MHDLTTQRVTEVLHLEQSADQLKHLARQWDTRAQRLRVQLADQLRERSTDTIRLPGATVTLVRQQRVIIPNPQEVVRLAEAAGDRQQVYRESLNISGLRRWALTHGLPAGSYVDYDHQVRITQQEQHVAIGTVATLTTDHAEPTE